MITVVGLGPGSLSRVPTSVREILLDLEVSLILRTDQHPAAAELLGMRDATTCDDLYEAADQFDDVYDQIVERLLEHPGDVVYAVPGSPTVGEFAVRRLVGLTDDVEVIPGESFVDAVLEQVAYDPLDRGLQILNGHDLPDPLVLDKPTIVAHVDRPEILADVVDAVARVTIESQELTVLAGIGADDAKTSTGLASDIDFALAGVRTSLFVDPVPTGIVGAIKVMRRLREECPWDTEQTHESLVKNLVEETFELVEAISALDTEDWVTYSAVEDELGDVLLQVLFHSAIARQVGAFDIDGVSTVLTEKLVRRHPHVFGDVVAESPEDVKRNWDEIKADERGKSHGSAIDGVPVSMPALHRSAKVQNKAAKAGFDWEVVSEVLPKVQEELEELEAAISGRGDTSSELGDLLFSVVNVARHLGVDPEVALRRSTDKFEHRFREMEAQGPLTGLTLEELDLRWEAAKQREGEGG